MRLFRRRIERRFREDGFWPELEGASVARRRSLHWTALMITGDAEAAARCIVDAAGLAEGDETAFRGWLMEWAQKATARSAASLMRSHLHAAAAQYAGKVCSHRHQPLSTEQSRCLLKLESRALMQFDILARAVLVLYGCFRIPLSECAAMLNVQEGSATGAYCQSLLKFADPQLRTQLIRPLMTSQLGFWDGLMRQC